MRGLFWTVDGPISMFWGGTITIHAFEGLEQLFHRQKGTDGAEKGYTPSLAR